MDRLSHTYSHSLHVHTNNNARAHWDADAQQRAQTRTETFSVGDRTLDKWRRRSAVETIHLVRPSLDLILLGQYGAKLLDFFFFNLVHWLVV